MGRLIGGSRSERLITAATALAIVIAIVAVIVLVTGGADDGDSGDSGDQVAYSKQAEQTCLSSKRAFAAVAKRVSRSENDPTAALALYAGAVAELAGDWRSRLAGLDPPSDRQEAADQLDEALAKVEDEASQVARQAQAGEDLKRLRVRLAAAGARAEQAIEALGLDACAEDGLGIGELQTG
jgi:hypothetical protein